jgi:ATP:corrinoid adenosyltransferase
LKFRLSPDFVIDSEQKPWNTEGLRVCIFGGAGSGKSWTAALLAEQFLSQGGSVVIFQPRAEYHTLRQKFDVVVVGGAYAKDMDFIPSSPSAYAKAVSEDGLSLVFYTTDVESEEKLVDFASRFMHYLLKYQEVNRRPVMLVLEESQDYIPKSPSGHAAPSWVYMRMTKAFKDGFLQGRKLNVVMVAVSPRPQEVNFTARQLSNITFYGKFSPQDISYIEKECLKWHSGLAFSAKDLLSLEAGQFLAVYGTEARIIRVTEPRLTSHGAETPQLKFTAPKREQTEKAISGLAEAVMAALEAEKRETSELEKAKARIKQLEAELAEAKKEVERLKTVLAVKETIKVEVKPAELKVPAELKLSEAKAVELQPKLPNIVESLDQDAKQVWALLRQKPGKYKAELMAAFGWGRRRLNRALRVLQNRRLLKVHGRKLYAAEPIV